MIGWKTIKDRNAPAERAWLHSVHGVGLGKQGVLLALFFKADRIWVNDAETHFCFESPIFNTHIRKTGRHNGKNRS